MIQPPLLKPGDTIGIAATARKISKEELQGGIQVIESWGLHVKYSSTLFSVENQFGGSDIERIKGFQELLDDKDVKAIIIVRGGYGTVRIIDALDFTQFKHQPKWIIGFSDVTVLHSHIHMRCSVQTLHGPMMLNMMPERFDLVSVDALGKTLMSNDIDSIAVETHPLNRQGKASGMIVGGNLSVLYSLLGSRSDIDTKGKILFLEDLDEYVYHIDRMMMNLKRTGKLDELAGLMVGDMSDMRDNTIPFGHSAYEIIAQHVKEYNYPVCFGFPAGHEKRNLAMKFGAESSLNVDAHQALFHQG